MKMRRTYKKRKYRRRRSLKKYVNYKIYKAINRNIETKYLDTTVDGTAGIIFGSALIQCVTQVTQGLGDVQRIGDRINVKSMHMRFNCVAADTVNRLRVSVFRWQEDTNFSVPSNSQIYQNIGTTIQSFFNFDNRANGKIQVIYDKIVDVETQNGDTQLYFNKFFKINKKIGFTGALAARGHIYVIVNSDSGVTPHPTFDGLCRVYFKDA